MPSSLRIPFLLDAISAALHDIEAVPPPTDRLLREAESLRAIVESWRQAPPTRGQHEGVMQRVVLLRTTAAKLRRK